MIEIQRKNMVRNQVRVVGVDDERIMAAMLTVPRHEFVDESHKEVAYSDSELQIDNGRLIARPEMIAKLLNVANIREDDIILEIGCGSGYASHIIAKIASEVVAIDNSKQIIEKATDLAQKLSVNNIDFIYQEDLTELSIDISGVTLAIINGAIFTRELEDTSHMQDKNDLFNIRTGHIRDKLMNVPKVLCVEGYYKFSPMSIVLYENNTRKTIDQVYFPELVI